MRSLLGVDVLVALLDAGHPDHRRARSWLESEIADGWASCAITSSWSEPRSLNSARKGVEASS